MLLRMEMTLVTLCNDKRKSTGTPLNHQTPQFTSNLTGQGLKMI